METVFETVFKQYWNWTVFKQYFYCLNTVPLLFQKCQIFEYCLHYCFEYCFITVQKFWALDWVYSDEQASIWPSWARSDSENCRNDTQGFFFFSNNFNWCGCAGVAATGGTRRAHNCTPVKDILLLADSNYITWAPSIPCCLLLRPPVSRLGIVQTLPSKYQKKFRIIIRRVQVRWHGYQRLWHSSTESEKKRGARVLSCKPPQGPLPHETAWVSCGDCCYQR